MENKSKIPFMLLNLADISLPLESIKVTKENDEYLQKWLGDQYIPKSASIYTFTFLDLNNPVKYRDIVEGYYIIKMKGKFYCLPDDESFEELMKVVNTICPNPLKIEIK